MDTSDVQQWFEGYFADFIALGRGDLDDVGRILGYYGAPLVLGTDAGCTVLADAAQVLAMAQQQVDGMRAAGYDRSDRLWGETILLNGAAALHRGRFARFRADGSEISRLEAGYLITDLANGRRISAIMVRSI